MLTWKEVAQERGTENSIQYKYDRVHSIICGSVFHRDERTGTSVRYDIPNRPYYRKSIAAMKQAQDLRYPFRVYWKLAVSKWENLGYYEVVGHVETPKSITFELTLKSNADGLDS